MRYSLVNRFRGALLGAFVSEKEILGSSSLGQFVTASCVSLLKFGKLDTDVCLELQSDPFFKESEPVKQQIQYILATLPVALFFHENPLKLRHHLLSVVGTWNNDPILRDVVLIFGYAIALSLQERFTSTSLIPQLVTFLGETSTELPQQLLKVQELSLQRKSLADVEGELIRDDQLSEMIAIGLYCFITSLEDFRVSVLRSCQDKNISSSASIITGSLSGAYNSISGIPISWQVNPLKPSFREIIELSDQLFAVWSGIYDFDSSANHDTVSKFAVVSARMVKWI